MSYSKSELLLLPTKEKLELAEALWRSVEEEIAPTSEEIAFAKERLDLHNQTPAEGVDVEAFKEHFSDKYGF